jgi:hypothetical protein
MEGNNNSGVCDVCGSGSGRCGKCGHACGFGGRHLLRWILGILIITWVFSIGMKVGEMKAVFEGSGYGDHFYYRSGPVMPMMYGNQGAAAGTVFFSSSAAAPAGEAGKVEIKKI